MLASVLLALACPQGVAAGDSLCAAYDSAHNRSLLVLEKRPGEVSDLVGRLADPGTGWLGAEFVISGTASWETSPAVAHDPVNGRYLVVWSDDRALGDFRYEIWGRVVGSDGSPEGPAFRIAGDLDRPMRTPAVAFCPGQQRYLVTWVETSLATDDDIRGLILDAVGSPLGSAFAVSAGPASQRSPAVECDTVNGRFLVAWQDFRSGAGPDVFGSLFDQAGVPFSPEFPIADSPPFQGGPKLAFDDVNGRFLAVWHQAPDAVSTAFDVHGRLVGSDGALLGGVAGDGFTVSDAAGEQVWPTVAFDPAAERFLVVWTDRRNEISTDDDVYGQIVGADGVLLDTGAAANVALRVSPGYQYAPVALHNGFCGNFAVALEEYGYGAAEPVPALITVGEPCPGPAEEVTLLSPVGGEVLPSGGEVSVAWLSPPGTARCSLERSLDGGASWVLVAAAAESPYAWLAPVPRRNRPNALVRVSAHGPEGEVLGSDTSGPFAVEVVRLTAPLPGAVLRSGTVVAVSWATNATRRRVARSAVLLTRNDGRTWERLRTVRGNPGTRRVALPAVARPNHNVRLRVTLRAAGGRALGRATSAPLTLRPERALP